jgi:soluble lytic murein transglycosylase-like protein
MTMRCLAAALALMLAAPLAQAASADPVDLRVMVRTEAAKRGLPPEIADAVATVESNYQPNAVGGVGEIGLMQVLPSTARMLGFAGTNQELAVPETNIRYGVDYLHGAWQLSGEDLCTTVMKYRAGHGESRFSHKSVAYCRRVRTVLAEQGYPIRGELPVATFGDPTPAMAATGGKKRVRSGINWSAYDRRIKAIESRVTDASLTIMR